MHGFTRASSVELITSPSPELYETRTLTAPETRSS